MIRFGMAVAATVGNVITGRAAQARAAQWTRFRALLVDLVVFSIVTVVVDVVYGVNALPWQWLSLLWMAYYIVPEGLYGASLGRALQRTPAHGAGLDLIPARKPTVVARPGDLSVDWIRRHQDVHRFHLAELELAVRVVAERRHARLRLADPQEKVVLRQR
jgi:hypothetical protein